MKLAINNERKMNETLNIYGDNCNNINNEDRTD